MANLFTADYPETLQSIASELGEKYSYKKELGSGANGLTHLIRDRKSNHPYCLKAVSPKITDKVHRERVRDSLKKEFEILKPLFHRCLPRIYEYEFSGNLPYYICSYHPGKTWEDFRLSGQFMRQEESVYIISSLIDAIGYLHENGRSHCDLHQDNILISPHVFREGVMIIDFGSGHRQSDAEPKTTDRGHLGFKVPAAQERHRKSVDRHIGSDDFKSADFRAVGRALQTMRPIFFRDATHEQNAAYYAFCLKLQRGEIVRAIDASAQFARVVDPNSLITRADPLFIARDGTGTAPFVASVAGAAKASGGASLKLCPMIRTLST